MRMKLLFALSLLCAGCAGDPLQTFYVPGYQMNAITGRPAYSGPPLPEGTVDPPVEYLQILSVEQAKSLGEHFAALGYRRIGMSMFEINWPTPHSDDAAEMGRKMGADLVLYAVIPAGTRLQSVPHLTYEPGQSYQGTTSGFVGGVFGSFHTYGSSSGSLRTQYTTEEVGRYTHVVGYLTKRK
jgi:hypothetical protein